MSNDNQPNWDALAEKFDLWLPHIAPVGEALLARLPIDSNDRVLDVASGTGEPATYLAQRNPNATIIGIDAAAGMVRAASNKPAIQALPNLEFRAMSAEQLDFADNSFDKLICRFGVMLFADPRQGLAEMQRVLKPGGHFALAVWGQAEALTGFQWSYRAFQNKIPEQDYPPLYKIASLGTPEILHEHLSTAGFNQIEIETLSVDYRFESFDEYWQLLEASDVMKQQLDALERERHIEVKNEMAAFAADFHGEDGLIIPHQYLVASGSK